MYYITLVSFIIAVLSFVYFFLQLVKRYILYEKVENYNLKFIISCSFTILFWLSTYSLNAVYERIQNPYINNNGVEEYSGTLGDLIGGTLNPILALFGILAGGLAFYAQYQANKQVQDQFKIQQFESRLFKMLDIYNTNVENLKFITRKRGNTFEGKMAFPSLVSNYNELQKDIKQYIRLKRINLQQIISEEYQNKIAPIDCNNLIIMELSYIIFLYGTGISGRKNIKTIFKEIYNEQFLNQLLNYLSNRPIEYLKKHKSHAKKWKNIFIDFETFDRPNNAKFDKYYNGHQNNLAHYFRHLYMILRYINEQENLSYLAKWEYSKLIRTQLSNHEQLLFFINSISVVGRNWEIKKTDVNEKLITKYDLIKNITKATRDKYNVEYFYPDVVFEDYAFNSAERLNYEKYFK